MNKRGILNKMPKGTLAAISIKEMCDGSFEVNHQGNIVATTNAINAAMSCPIIRMAVLGAVGVYFRSKRDDLGANIIQIEMRQNEEDFNSKMKEAKESSE